MRLTFLAMVGSQASEKAFRNRASDGEAVDKRESNSTGDCSNMDFSRWILDLLRPNHGERVLEIGCGRGTQTIPLAQAVGQTGFVSFPRSLKRVGQLCAVRNCGDHWHKADDRRNGRHR